MAIQFNLLPDVKMNYIKARRTKRSVVMGSSIAVIVCLSALIILSLVVFLWQGVRLSSLDKSIKESSANIKGRADINKVLTIQNQLTAIDNLHAARPVAPRMFDYITQVTPSNITMQTFNIDYTTESPTISITGLAPNIEEINQFIDTLKFTSYTKSADDTEKPKAFSQVVLSAFGPEQGGVGYTIKLNYDPAIFASEHKDVKLIVPKITSTRSETERPTEIFKANPGPAKEDTP